MAIDRAALLKLLNSPRYHQFLDLELEELGEDSIKLRLPFKEDFLGDEAGTYIHGGIIASLIDIAGDFALITSFGRGLPTIDLRIDYLRPALKEDLIASAVVVKKGRTLGISDITITNEAGQKIAIGRGLYSTAAPKGNH
ncbi:HotDog domain-containing protein [Paenibacillus sp. 32O-W]|uniref:PaaI family thioesterase n=1 Tax=Paenibacillus sp. 32O-W TaxID=1695218 RepID=UPI000720D847|nr:PaaI family thioesterase [Paenibacillus sp. 32O-W]ALS29941.1 HotDog domain-containing protein [Paenibacillus sp. 32O-W]